MTDVIEDLWHVQFFYKNGTFEEFICTEQEYDDNLLEHVTGKELKKIIIETFDANDKPEIE